MVSVGCGKGATADADLPLGSRDNTAEVEEYYRTKVSLPVEVREALERGEISQAEIDERTVAGEFPKFFRFATPADLPADLEWEDGMDLPELGSPEATKGGTLFMAITDFPRTLRVVGPDANGSFRAYLQDETLYTYAVRHPNVTEIGPNGHRYMPAIANEWAVDREAKTVYVRINPAARWSDGRSVTTADTLFTYYMFQSPHIRAPWYNNAYHRQFTEVAVYDEHTFSVTVPEGKPDMNKRVLETRPFPRHFFLDFGDDYPERYQWEFLPTTGAYVIKEEDIKKGRSITYTRDEDWWARDLKFWRHRFNPDRIHFTVIRDKAKAFESFKKGELDTVRMREPDYWFDKLADDDPLVADGYIHKHQFYDDKPRPTYGLWINTAQSPLDSKLVRQGLQFATNWDLVIERYFRGSYVRMRTSADGYGQFTHPDLQPRPYSVAKALAKFTEAGFTERGDDGILVNDAGQRLSVTLTSGRESLKDILTILREQALPAGLEYRIEILDATASFKKAQEKKHDIVFTAFAVGPEMYPRYWETYHSVNAYDQAFLADGSVNRDRKLKPQTNNLHSLANAELDAMIERYRASEEVEEMLDLAFRIEELLHEEAVFSPGYVMPYLQAGSWRWIGWPEGFSNKIAHYYESEWMQWVDEEKREETLRAKRSGQTFPKHAKVYDQHRIR
ncbi:MAG: extracellular solute-binding protein [Acidobacteriota bacterium]|nr:extracellular solute-binding protein [Acidobacteriota bacterium]